MTGQKDSTDRTILRSSIILGAMIFIADFFVPVGNAIWVFYAVPLLLSARLPKRGASYFMVGYLTLLITAGLFVGTGSAPLVRPGLFNRLAGIISLWIIAALIERYKVTSGIRVLNEELAAARSIAERRAREAEEGRSILDALMQHVPEALQIIDKKRTILRSSRFSQKLTGHPAEEIEGISVEDRNIRVPLFHPDGVTAARAEELPVIRVLKTGTSVINEEWKVKTSPATFMDISVNAGPVRDSKGNVTGAVTTWHDITGRKKAEEALRESREDLNHAQTVGHIGSWRLNIPRNELNWSDEVYRIFNVSPGTPLTYEKFLSYVHPEDREYVDRMWKAALKGKPYDIEHRILIERNVTWVREKAELEFDQNGGIRAGFGIVQDITERKCAEEELRESERRFRSLYENSFEAILLTKPDGTILSANSTAQRTFGMSEEEIKKAGRSGIVVRDERWASALEEHRRTGHVRAVLTFKRKDGSTFTGEASSSSFRDADGSLKTSMIIRDITERIIAEETLRHEHDLLQTIIDSIPVMLTIYDPAIKHVLVNKYFTQVAGWTREDARQDLMAKVYPEPGERARLTEYMQSLTPGWRDLIMTAKNGSTIESSWANVRLPDGRQVGIGLDIRERKKAEDTLRENEERFRALANASSAVIFRMSPDWSEMLQLSSRTFLASTEKPNPYWLQEYIPEEEQALVTARIQKAIRERSAFELEHRVRQADGSIGWTLSRAVPLIDSKGKIIEWFGAASDITERKKAESQREAALEAVRASEATLNAFFEYSPVTLAIRDEELRYLKIDTHSARTYFGVEPGQVKGKMQENFVPKIGETVDRYSRRVLEKGATVQIEINPYFPVLGRKVSFLTNYFPVPLANGRQGVGTISVDITDRIRAEDTLRRSEYELRTLVDNSPDLIIRFNRRMEYVFVNPAYERIAGFTKEQFTGKTNEQLGMPRQMVEFWRSALRDVINSGREHSVEFNMPGLFGTRYFFARLIPEFEKSGLVETVLVIARDITERKQAEEQIRYISFHDEVTGLFNRAFFEEEIHRLDTARELPISIVMGDVNNLKLMNDVFGHEEGDRSLKAVANIFLKAYRKNDIIARWGGDEFAVILPRTGFSAAREVCDRIKQLAKEAKEMIIQPSIALGAATKQNNDQNIYRIIRQAEERMYQNKLDESRENEQCVYDSLFERNRERVNDMDVHLDRSHALGDRFAAALSLSESQRDDLHLLIRLHDIGNAVTPREIMTKPGRLAPHEWEAMKKHSEAGFRIVKTFADTARISDEVLAHTEYWDGSGYPRGLTGKVIPYLARVFRIIDAYDIMTHPRPYARTLTREEAVVELKRNAGKQFDPELAEIFITKVLVRERQTAGT